jgi:Family of unknown function (DUF6636)
VRRGILIATAALVSLALALPASSSAALNLHGLRFFHTADNNIACGMVKGEKKRKRTRHRRGRSALPGEARCDVKNHTWVAPPAPRSCDLDWGFGVAVSDRRPANYVCAGDTVADQRAPVLAAGGTITLGRYTCSVLTLAVTTVHCQNNLTSHGFDVSAETVYLF